MNPTLPEAPELLALKLRVSIATHVDPYEFADWSRANLIDLRARFHGSGEPIPLMGLWLREEFVAERTLNSQPASDCCTAPVSRHQQRKSAGSLIDFCMELAPEETVVSMNPADVIKGSVAEARAAMAEAALELSRQRTRINALETALNRMVLAHENLVSDTEGKYPPPDAGCIACTVGTVPNRYNTGLCPLHTSKKLLGQL